MGYSVYYSGEITVTPALTEEHAETVRLLLLRQECDATRPVFAAIAAGGEDLPYHVGLLEVSEERDRILPEDGESRDGAALWLHLLLTYYLAPLGYGMKGEINWMGEDMDDRGVIYVAGSLTESGFDSIWDQGPVWAPRHSADKELLSMLCQFLQRAEEAGRIDVGGTVIATEMTRLREVLRDITNTSHLG